MAGPGVPGEELPWAGEVCRPAATLPPSNLMAWTQPLERPGQAGTGVTRPSFEGQALLQAAADSGGQSGSGQEGHLTTSKCQSRHILSE